MQLSNYIVPGVEYQIEVRLHLRCRKQPIIIESVKPLEIIDRAIYLKGKTQIHCCLHITLNAYTDKPRRLIFTSYAYRKCRKSKSDQFCRVLNQDGTDTTFNIHKIYLSECWKIILTSNLKFCIMNISIDKMLTKKRKLAGLWPYTGCNKLNAAASIKQRACNEASQR